MHSITITWIRGKADYYAINKNGTQYALFVTSEWQDPTTCWLTVDDVEVGDVIEVYEARQVGQFPEPVGTVLAGCTLEQ